MQKKIHIMLGKLFSWNYSISLIRCFYKFAQIKRTIAMLCWCLHMGLWMRVYFPVCLLVVSTWQLLTLWKWIDIMCIIEEISCTMWCIDQSAYLKGEGGFVRLLRRSVFISYRSGCKITGPFWRISVSCQANRNLRKLFYTHLLLSGELWKWLLSWTQRKSSVAAVAARYVSPHAVHVIDQIERFYLV